MKTDTEKHAVEVVQKRLLSSDVGYTLARSIDEEIIRQIKQESRSDEDASIAYLCTTLDVLSKLEKTESIQCAILECESPIERLLLVGLHAQSLIMQIPRTIQYVLYPNDGEAQPESYSTLYVTPQAHLGKYRIDFHFRYVELAIVKSVADKWDQKWCSSETYVECDGHDFHERTKAQAKKDRARDRRIQDMGFPILRFTGSELWADPTDCAEQLLKFLRRAAFKSIGAKPPVGAFGGGDE